MNGSQEKKVSGLSKKIQDLLDIVSESENIQTKQPKKKSKAKKQAIDHTHLMRFIRYSSMEAGDIKVKTHYLWYLYSAWEYRGIKYPKIEYFRRLSKMFKSGRYNRTRYYYLNMDVTSEIKEKADNYKESEDRKSYAEREKKRKEAAKLARATKEVSLS